MAFEQLCEGREFYRGHGSVVAYLTKCVRHRLVDCLRRRQARQRRETDRPDPTITRAFRTELNPYALVCAYQRNEAVRQAVRNLPPDQWRVVELVYFDSRSRREAAKILHVDRRTIDRRCSAALENLKQRLPRSMLSW